MDMASMLSKSNCSDKRAASEDSLRFPAVLVPLPLFWTAVYMMAVPAATSPA